MAAPSGWIFNKIYFPAKIEKIELPTWPLPALRFRPVEMTYIYKIKFSLSEIFKENNSPAGGGTTLVLYIIFIRKLLAEDKMWSFLHSHTFIGEKHCHSIKVSIVTRTFLIRIFCIKVLLFQTNTKYFCTLFDWIDQTTAQRPIQRLSQVVLVLCFMWIYLVKVWLSENTGLMRMLSYITFLSTKFSVGIISNRTNQVLRHSVFS